MYTRILVATDGSKLSKKAVVSAISLAATCKAELLAMQVVPPYPIAYFEGGMATDSREIKRVEALWINKAQAVLDLVKKAGAELIGFCRFHLGEGIDKATGDFAAEVRAAAGV